MDIQRSTGNRKGRRRLALIGVGAAVLAMLGITAFKFGSGTRTVDADLVWSGEVTRGEFIHEVTAAGALVATDIRVVANRNDGVVERVLVHPGQVVQPQDVLLELSSSTLPDELLKMQSALEAAEADARVQRAKADDELLGLQVTLAGYEAEYNAAQYEADAKQKIYDKYRVMSELEVRNVVAQAEQRKRRLEAGKTQLARYPLTRAAQEEGAAAKLNQQRREISRLEKQIADLKVTAGFSGVVQSVDVEVGKRVTAGAQVARVVNPSSLVARVRVSERDAALVVIGQVATLETGRRTLSGKVIRVEPTVQDRLVTVDIELDGSERDGMRPDLTVTAHIEIERAADALVLDRPAALRDEQKSLRLFRLEKGGKLAKLVDVQIGRISSRHIEITRGLGAGDKVILADMSEWADQSQIAIR
jgi:RND family efflux transporter MFP subunit